MKTSDVVATESLTEEQRLGIRRAHLAAVYANLRTLLAQTLREKDPVVGVFGFHVTEAGAPGMITAGATPKLQDLLSYLGWLNGHVITHYVARQVGDKANAGTGDGYDLALGATRCDGCEDGDPTGAHAKQELEENARAWLGVVLLVAERFYAPHLTERARALLVELGTEMLPPDAQVK